MIFFYENFHKFFHSFLFPKILKHCVSRIQNIGLDEGKQKIVHPFQGCQKKPPPKKKKFKKVVIFRTVGEFWVYKKGAYHFLLLQICQIYPAYKSG